MAQKEMTFTTADVYRFFKAFAGGGPEIGRPTSSELLEASPEALARRAIESSDGLLLEADLSGQIALAALELDEERGLLIAGEFGVEIGEEGRAKPAKKDWASLEDLLGRAPTAEEKEALREAMEEGFA